MGFLNFLQQTPRQPHVQISHVESAKLGFQVGRLLCGVHTDWNTFDPITAIEESDAQAVIMRYPSDQYDIAERLAHSTLESWTADTLIYFTCDVLAIESPRDRGLADSLQGFSLEVAALIEQIFTGYQNHYSASSYFSNVDVTAAYVDWARHLLEATNNECNVIKTQAGRLVGLAICDTQDTTMNEISLIGVHPEFRNRGVFSELLRHLADRARQSGKATLATSTQSANLASMRGLTRTGFLPTLSLNTLHIVKTETLERS